MICYISLKILIDFQSFIEDSLANRSYINYINVVKIKIKAEQIVQWVRHMACMKLTQL